MKRYAAMALVAGAVAIAATPCRAQILQKLEQSLLGGQGQQPGMAQPQPIGTANLPPGNYIMTNTQTGQAFYITLQNGQLYLTGQNSQAPAMAPGQGMGYPGQGMGYPGQGMGYPGQGMMPQQQPQQGGGLMNGVGNFLRNEMAPAPQPGQ